MILTRQVDLDFSLDIMCIVLCAQTSPISLHDLHQYVYWKCMSGPTQGQSNVLAPPATRCLLKAHERTHTGENSLPWPGIGFPHCGSVLALTVNVVKVPIAILMEQWFGMSIHDNLKLFFWRWHIDPHRGEAISLNDARQDIYWKCTNRPTQGRNHFLARTATRSLLKAH